MQPKLSRVAFMRETLGVSMPDIRAWGGLNARGDVVLGHETPHYRVMQSADTLNVTLWARDWLDGAGNEQARTRARERLAHAADLLVGAIPRGYVVLCQQNADGRIASYRYRPDCVWLITDVRKVHDSDMIRATCIRVPLAEYMDPF